MTNGWNGLRKELLEEKQNKVMKKAVAIPYVIALILGVVVIGLLGYWFVSQGGKTVGEGDKAECQAKIFSYCVQWQNNDKECKSNAPVTTIEGCGITSNKPQKPDCEKIGLCK